MIEKYSTHKDENPFNTVQNIRNILYDYNISITENGWKTFKGSSYTVRLLFANFELNHLMGTNGKGVNPNYSLASAYGEFMERLQNYKLLPIKYGLMNDLQLTELHSGKIKLHEFNEKIKKSSLMEKSIEKYNDFDCDTHLYYSVREKKEISLPSDIISSSCFTNGMCAGNTREEALCQGLCEVYERYAARLVFLDKKKPKNINHKYLQKLDVYQLLYPFKKKGFEIIFKDCSFDLEIPVVALIL